MKIGELAARADTQVETIRYYEREGLLPAAPRTDGNYRIYGDEHLERLAFIRHCRSLDMTLDEIRVLLRFKDDPEADCGDVDALLDEHIGHVAARIRNLRQLGVDGDHPPEGEGVESGGRRLAEALAAGDAHHPTTPSPVAKERPHGRGELRPHRLGPRDVPGERDVPAEDVVELRDVFDGDRNVQRTGGREPDERCDIHPRQRLGELRRSSLESGPRQSTNRAHRDHSISSRS